MVEIKSLNCPNCGDSIPDTSKACPSCGSRVILSDDRQKFVLAGTICPKCGLDNKEQHRFCSKCGDKLFKECPKCHKEIGLDSVHCPFCGNNLDTAAKEREIELVRHKDRLSQMELLKQKVELLEQKKKPLSDEYSKLSQQVGQVCRRVDYSDDRELSAANMIFLIYPIGALILSGIAYLMGLKDFFSLIFIISYFGIFYFFYLSPSMECKKLKGKSELLRKEIEAINIETQAKLHEISSLNATLNEAISKYKF